MNIITLSCPAILSYLTTEVSRFWQYQYFRPLSGRPHVSMPPLIQDAFILQMHFMLNTICTQRSTVFTYSPTLHCEQIGSRSLRFPPWASHTMPGINRCSIKAFLLMTGTPDVFGKPSMSPAVWSPIQLSPLVLPWDPPSQTWPCFLQIGCCYYKTFQTCREVKPPRPYPSDIMNVDLGSYYSSSGF